MYRGLPAHWLGRALRTCEASPSTGLLLSLRPAVRPSSAVRSASLSGARWCRVRTLHTEAIAPDEGRASLAQPATTTATTTTSTTSTASTSTSTSTITPATRAPEVQRPPTRRLPLMCSGCGAFSQTEDSQQLGFFDPKSKRVRMWVDPPKPRTKPDNDSERIVAEVLQGLDDSRLKELGLKPADLLLEDAESWADAAVQPTKAPLCDRCHNLIHYSTTSDSAKVPMFHPTVESLRETIEESPHKYNHIYHIIDAADFPMSLIPRLNVLLGDISLRTRNRRSRAGKYHKNRQTEMSFIITRGDLLGPTKEMVDAMMPYLREVLREALGRVGGRIRLGNVRCVSAKRSWWTTQLKEDIWKRGGAGWMVGKVNVGKSQLFEAVYPKGRMTETKAAAPPHTANVSMYPRGAVAAESLPGSRQEEEEEAALEDDRLGEIDFGELLPPAQPATNYPEMPLVSSLPGTTASPIRIPFGNGRGELIDLPGLARSDLELFVREEHRQSLIMRKRIVPEQLTVKTGRSLLLGGGLIRITPTTPDTVFLMYNFTPLEEHLTMTEKAVEFQHQARAAAGVENITLPLPDAAGTMRLAGTFRLRHDVTKKRAGPLTRKNAIGIQVDRLPFRVLSVDILIEGVGYVEIVAQVRARDVARFPALEAEAGEDAGLPEDRERERKRERHARERPDRRSRAVSERNGLRDKEVEDDDDDEDSFLEKFKLRRDSRGSLVDGPKAGSRPEAGSTRGAEGQPEADLDWPAVEVYTPEGRFVGSRQPLQGWLNNKPRVLPEHKRGRPRKSMKGEKKKQKQLRREASAAP